MNIKTQNTDEVNAKNPPSRFKPIIQGTLTVAISVLIIFAVVKAGTITPPAGTPAAKFYTLTEIYNFITANTAATEGGHGFTFADALDSTHRTLTEIYNALAGLISSDNVKLGTTYLGVAGRLTPIMTDGTATTTAVAADVLSGKTAHLSADWTLDTGTMTNNGAFALTASNTNQTVTAGYYSGGTLAGDADLAAGNIKTGTDIFGVTGTLGLLKTGQTTQYASKSDDGLYEKGTERSYTDNGDGTVTDNVTGLMWELKTNDGSIHDKDNTYAWTDAFDVFIAGVNAANFAGHNDWRLPNNNELFSICISEAGAIDGVKAAGSPYINQTVFATAPYYTQGGYYWTSTTCPGDTSMALFVNFWYGSGNILAKTTSEGMYARAVRGGQ